jgi:hypothetical protein
MMTSLVPLSADEHAATDARVLALRWDRALAALATASKGLPSGPVVSLTRCVDALSTARVRDDAAHIAEALDEAKYVLIDIRASLRAAGGALNARAAVETALDCLGKLWCVVT